MKRPIPDCYWVEHGRLLAGEYPGAKLDGDALQKLARFGAARITSFVDLTEEDEGLSPYETLLKPGLRYMRHAIRDMDVPSPTEMRAILDTIDAELAAGHVVYVHCWGGHGRTGTVVGCWLVRRGRSPEEALERIAELRLGVPDADWHHSPERPHQRELIARWRELDHPPDPERA